MVLHRGAAFWQSQREELQRLYWDQNLSSIEIGKLYDVEGITILRWMKKLGIERKAIGSDARPNALYSLNSHFFDQIDTAEKAYVLGFVASDGHVSKKNTLMFAQSKTEEDILYKIRTALQSNHPIKDKTRKKRSGKYQPKPAVTFAVRSEILCNRLREIGLTNNKSMDFDVSHVLSFVPKEFERDFVRGMFDGDGSVRIYKYSYFPKHTYHFGFTGLKKTCDYVQGVFGLNTKMADEGNGIYTVVSACRTDIVRIGHYMYDDATIYLDRKKETFDRVYALVAAEA